MPARHNKRYSNRAIASNNALSRKLSKLFDFNKKSFLYSLKQHLNKPILIPLDNDSKLYVSLLSYDTQVYFFAVDIMVSFTLKKNIDQIVLLDSLQNSSEESEIHEVLIESNTEIIGEQIFFYTFSSLSGIIKSKISFEKYIQDEFMPEEKRRADNQYYWDMPQKS
jgi:hypothetical protein